MLNLQAFKNNFIFKLQINQIKNKIKLNNK